MITRIHSIIGLPLVAALTILMCAYAPGEAAEAKPQAGAPDGTTKTASEPKPGAGTKMCTDHNLPESECGICHPERAAALKPGEGSKVRMPAADSASLVGVEMSQATVGDISEGIECYAELAFNQNRLAQIAAPVRGVLQAVDADLGTKVEEKQTLAKIWSAAIAEAVAKAVLSHQTLERERKLWAERVSSEKDLQQAEADHRAACQQLRTQGFTEDQIDLLGRLPQEQVLMEVRAPFAGEIVERNAVRGTLVEAGKSLFTLADRSTMWADAQYPGVGPDAREGGADRGIASGGAAGPAV